MAQADLLVNLVKNASSGDQLAMRRVAEDLIQEEKNKGHRLLAERLTKALRPTIAKTFRNNTNNKTVFSSEYKDLFYQITPERSLSTLVLNKMIRNQVIEIIEEQHRSELLHAHNLKARNRILLAGPPGNGKTTLAEALAYELMYPLLVVRYETLVGSFLGETSSRLKYLFDFAKTQRCVLFFDEFETLGKERGDLHETGEIKRVVSSLLLQIDDLPDHVVIVAASNHSELLDRAVWRRFQLRLELPLPTRAQLSSFIMSISNRSNIDFGYAEETLAKHLKGLNFAEVEEFCLGIVRRAILDRKTRNARTISKLKLEQLKSQLNPTNLNTLIE